MLNSLRKGMRSFLAVIIFAPIIFAFMFMDVGGIFRGRTATSAVTVGGEAISNDEIRRIYDNLRSRAAQGGEPIADRDARLMGLDRVAIEQVSTRVAFEQEARRLNIEASGKMVADDIRTDLNFAHPATGEFDRVIYESLLARSGLNPAMYERDLRRNLGAQQLEAAVSAGAIAPQVLAEALYLRQNEVRNVDYLLVQPADVGDAPEPSEEQLVQFHADNEARFSNPEFRSVGLVIISPTDFMADVEVSDDDLQAAYRFREDEFIIPERRTLRRLNFGSEEEAAGAAERLRAGEAFETLAAEQNADPDELTFEQVTQDQLTDSLVADAGFAGDEQGVRPPAQTAFGWTVVIVSEVFPESVTAFEDVREQLRSDLASEDAKDLVFEAAGDFDDLRHDGLTLAEAAEQLGLRSYLFADLDRSGGSAAGDDRPAVLTSAMLNEAYALDDGEESDLTPYEDGAYFGISVETVTPSAVRPLDEARTEVGAAWRADWLADQLSERAQALVESAKELGGLSAAAEADNKAVLKREIRFETQDEIFSRELSVLLFGAAQGDIIDERAGLGDSRVVAEITNVQVGQAGEDSVAQIDALRQFLVQARTQELMEAYVVGLREEFPVEINDELLAQLFPPLN